MPIQASNLMLATFSIPDVPDAFPSVAAAVLVSGGNGKINGEPTWTPANELIFTTDKDGYLNPWILRGVESDALLNQSLYRRSPFQKNSENPRGSLDFPVSPCTMSGGSSFRHFGVGGPSFILPTSIHRSSSLLSRHLSSYNMFAVWAMAKSCL